MSTIKNSDIVVLYSLAEAMNQRKTTEELFDLLMQWMDGIFGLEVGVMRLLEDEYLKLVASRGIPGELREKIELIHVGDSIAGLVASIENAIVVEDIPTVSGPYVVTSKDIGLECIISIPIKARERVIGTLSVGSRHRRGLTEEHIETLKSVGDLLGRALERFREFENVGREKSQWETVLRTTNDLVSVHDRYFTIRTVNPALLKCFGVKEEEVLGRPCYEVFHGTTGPPEGCPSARVFSTSSSTSATIESKDGQVFSVTTYPIFKSGQVDGVIHIARDVTEIVRLREQLHQADKLGAIGRFAAGIAHNVNNPLTYVMNYLYILKDGVKAEGERLIVDKIEQGVKRARDILNGLIDLSNPSGGAVEVIELGDAVKETVSFIRPDLEKHGMALDLDTDPGTYIKASRRGIGEVVLNLVTNSVDASASKISIDVYRDNKNASIVVSDNGSGIEPEHIKRVFEPYFTTKSAHKGTGLGLYVSFNIVKSLGGDIWCTSRKGSGTQFVLDFPIQHP